MAPRKGKVKEESPLLSALRFVSVAQKELGPQPQRHCHIMNGGIMASDGVLAAGVPYSEPLPPCAPATFQLIQLLATAKGAVTMTFENQALLFKSEKLRATVDCLDPLTLSATMPDAASYPLTDTFKRAGMIAGALTKEGAQSVQLASVLTRDGSLVGTNNAAIVEAFHGSPTPPGLILPKTFFDHLAKIAKPITRFGFSQQSFTVWFDDGSWLKTQLYIDRWPDASELLNKVDAMVPQTVPKDFFDAIAAVAPFSEDHRVYFGAGNVMSHATDAKGAVHYLKGAPKNLALNFKHVQALAAFMSEVDFTTDEKAVLFRALDIEGCKVRGLLGKMALPTTAGADLDADIPF